MKRSYCLLALLLYVLLFPTPVRAATYTDPMTDLNADRIKSYTNLVAASSLNTPAPLLAEIQGRGGLTFSGDSLYLAHVDYRVRGADSVTVSFYTPRGAFSPYLSDNGLYTLGIPAGYTISQLSSWEPVLISSADRHLYIRPGNTPQRLTLSDNAFSFRSAGGAGALVYYGVNVYAGASAGSLSMVQQSASALSSRVVSYSGTHCLERVTFSLPPGTQYVRVEINDLEAVDMQYPNGSVGVVSRPFSVRTTLSAVSFTGDSLVMGEPEPAVSSSGSSSSRESSSQAGRKSSSSAPASPASSGSSAQGSQSSSKYQGEIVAESSSASSKRAAAQPEKEKSPSSSMVEEEDSRPTEPTRQVFELRAPARSSSFGIGLYITVICMLLVLLLLRGKG